MTDKIAIVTGANKGIGFGIVKELCKRSIKTVYLTSRDVKRGTDALDKLKSEGFNPLFHQLDVTDPISVQAFAAHIGKSRGGIDILFNNAGVICKEFRATSYDDAKHVIDVNFKSILIVEKYLYPLLRDNARVINMSSDCGHISHLSNQNWIKKLTNQDCKLNDVNEFVDWFIESIKNDALLENDFNDNYFLSYKVSKIALSAYTRVQQREIGRNISINLLHPGFVKTSMTKESGVMTVEEASHTPVYLALDADQSLKGKYIWFDRSEKDWANPNEKTDYYIDPEVIEDFLNKMS
ncbi:carbonyl reductase [NADPH] 3-like [Leptidea sinapis]|uniref:carbonyl reductase [NADPH] 3-like n=1 Tax=Leptidea sinapis TaxID=189913 RepID=UPI00212E574A|nr:carbonyl reductase [NADPH] 3-like [Leptidea sinapis]